MRVGLCICVGLFLWASAAVAQACTAPYQVRTTQGSCVWSCGSGTQPDQASGTCVCKSGLKAAGQDSAGRLTCEQKKAVKVKKKSPTVKSKTPKATVRKKPQKKVSGKVKRSRRLSEKYPMWTRMQELCDLFTQGDLRYPQKCTVTPSTPRIQIHTAPRIQVSKANPWKPKQLDIGRFSYTFSGPSQPAPNPECREGGYAADICHADCLRVYLLDFYADGTLRRNSEPRRGLTPDCAKGHLTTDFLDERLRASTQVLSLAHDACARKAEALNISPWGHAVEVNIRRRLAAAFLYEDNYGTITRRKSDGVVHVKKEFHQQEQRHYREGYMTYTLYVVCTP